MSIRKRPNVLILFTDQQRHDTIEAHGNPFIRTPVLNGLSKRGVHFTRAYTPCPVCVGARYSMLTGQLPHRTGCADNEPSSYRRSLMEVFRDNGYQTMGVGKMHFTLTEPSAGEVDSLQAFIGANTNLAEKWGFERRLTSECDDADDYKKFVRAAGYGHVADATGERSEMYYIPQPAQVPAELTETAWVANRSIDFLKSRDIGRPFFLMTSFQAPHPPFVAPFPWNKLYRGADMALPMKPEGFEHLQTLWNKYQNRYKYTDQGVGGNQLRTMKAYYYAMISFLDYQIGMLLAFLESEGLMDNTVILFTSDHGELLGDYGCFGKRCFLDAAARVPMILTYPGCQTGARVDDPVSLVDVFPTLLELARIEDDLDLSGESLLAAIDGRPRREAIYGQFQHAGLASYMAVAGEYKYVYSAPDNREWMFDLRGGGGETRSIAGNPLYARKTDEMRSRLIEFFREEGYVEPIDGGVWKRYPARDLTDDPDAYLLFQDAGAIVPEIEGYVTDANSLKYFRNSWYE